MNLILEGADVGSWGRPLPFAELDWDARAKPHFWLEPDDGVTIDLFFDRLHPEDRERVRRDIETAIAKRESYETEYRTVRPETGAVKWLSRSRPRFL